MHACMYKVYSEHVTGRVQVCTRAGMYHVQAPPQKHVGQGLLWPIGRQWLGTVMGGSWLSRAL